MQSPGSRNTESAADTIPFVDEGGPESGVAHRKGKTSQAPAQHFFLVYMVKEYRAAYTLRRLLVSHPAVAAVGEAFLLYFADADGDPARFPFGPAQFLVRGQTNRGNIRGAGIGQL